MSRLQTEELGSFSGPSAREDRGRHAAEERGRSRGLPTGWLLVGAVAVGLGALAWYYLGPDVRRYMKIRNM
jgi:hypothetical protein